MMPFKGLKTEDMDFLWEPGTVIVGGEMPSFYSVALLDPYPPSAPVDTDGKRINPQACLESDNRLLLLYVGGE